LGESRPIAEIACAISCAYPPAVSDTAINAGIYLLAALSGITDVDAVTLSMSRMSQSDLPAVVASGAIVVAALVNTVVKGCIAVGIARSRMGWQVFGALVVVAAAGALASMLELPGLGTSAAVN